MKECLYYCNLAVCKFTFPRVFERGLLKEGDDFARVILKIAHRSANLLREIFLTGDRHAADAARFRVAEIDVDSLFLGALAEFG